MGNIIVPAQPFGYNYLGGKLIAASVVPRGRERVMEKYPESTVVSFETASHGSAEHVNVRWDEACLSTTVNSIRLHLTSTTTHSVNLTTGL